MHFFVAKLLSIAVMTYSYVRHFRNLRPANLLRIQLINFSMRPQQVRMKRDPTVIWCLRSREPQRISALYYITLYCQKLESMNYMTAATVSVYCIYFYAIVFESQGKMFKTSVNARPCTLLRLLSREPQRISAQTLYCQKLESLPKICTVDNICLSLLVSTQFF